MKKYYVTVRDTSEALIIMKNDCPYYSKCKSCPVDALPDDATYEQCEAACESSACK